MTIPGFIDPSVALVYDYSDKGVQLPPGTRTPRPDQFQGTELEKLVETAGRECYASFGKKKSRNSPDYHAHIREVNHGSVNEHPHITLQFEAPTGADDCYVLLALANRPGVWLETRGLRGDPLTYRVTINLRAANEWHFWTLRSLGQHRNSFVEDAALRIGLMIQYQLHQLAPMVVPFSFSGAERWFEEWVLKSKDKKWFARPVPPESENEKHVTLWLSCSRAVSLEQARHRFQISQRSTRFCDESESPYVLHPLIKKAMEVEAQPILDIIQSGRTAANQVYTELCTVLQEWVAANNPHLDKTSALKQARGAARGYLGNALSTSTIFTASVAEWKGMIEQRAHDAADAEIRAMYADTQASVLAVLKESQYGDAFQGYTVVAATDGLTNRVVRETGAAIRSV